MTYGGELCNVSSEMNHLMFLIRKEIDYANGLTPDKRRNKRLKLSSVQSGEISSLCTFCIGLMKLQNTPVHLTGTTCCSVKRSYSFSLR